MSETLRDWQAEAIRKYDLAQARDFLICATPGAGKTRLALTMAKRLLAEQTAHRVVVVVPADALRQQWADDASEVGLDLMPVSAPEDYDKTGYHGCVVTYAQLAFAGSDLLRRATRIPTVALLDEVHHAGDQQAWGQGIQNALELATRRIGLTGTPWRQDRTSLIPFVQYDTNGKVIVDHAYEYGEAVADGVCRRVEFHAYDGEAKWIDCGRIVSAAVNEELRDDDVSAVLDTILDPRRDWMPGLVANAVEDLRRLRTEVPDAGGLVIAERQWQAHEYAKLIERLAGEPATVVVSDDPSAAGKIDEFRRGRSSWLVAVRMVSEGVDIKRLAVGVYGAKVQTPLFFRQVVGRFVRTRPDEEINAKLFIPAIPVFMRHAKEIEDELRHQLDLTRDQHDKSTRDTENGQRMFELREPLSASEPSFASSIFGGVQNSAETHARAEKWCRDRSIPVMYAPNVIPDVLAEESAKQVTITPVAPAAPRNRREKMLRTEIKTLVNKIARRSGVQPQEVNLDLLRRGFRPRAECGIEELEQIQQVLVDWWANL